MFGDRRFATVWGLFALLASFSVTVIAAFAGTQAACSLTVGVPVSDSQHLEQDVRAVTAELQEITSVRFFVFTYSPTDSSTGDITVRFGEVRDPDTVLGTAYVSSYPLRGSIVVNEKYRDDRQGLNTVLAGDEFSVLPAYFSASSKSSMRMLLRHEFAHVLGLGHSWHPASTMATKLPSYTSSPGFDDVTRQDLEQLWRGCRQSGQ